jgi:spore coat protein U-like protein
LCGGRGDLTVTSIMRLLCAAALVIGCAAPASAWCSISVSPVNFGTYNVFAGSPTDSVGQVTLFCFLDDNVSVTISKGSSGTYNQRAMQNGTERLSYNLFRDAARTVVWGDGSGGTSTYIVPFAILTNVPIPVYGRVPPEQDVRTGAYSDSVTVVVNF